MDLKSAAAVLAEDISALKDEIRYKNELARLAAGFAGNISAAFSAGHPGSVMQFLQNAKHTLNEAGALIQEKSTADPAENDDLARIEELLSICRKSLYSEIKRTALHIC